MRAIAPGPISLVLMAATVAVSLSACNATLLGTTQPASQQPVTSNPSKTTPVITWPQPAPITNPAPLTSVQLDATANVPGTFTYSPAAGIVLPAGTQTLTATFTPTDTADYNSATASVTIVVNASATTPPGVGSGHLAVADSENNRVLIYDAPFTTGMSASVILGQPNFSSNSWLTPTSNSLLIPEGLAMDAAGRLLVVDQSENRVMEFQPMFANGMDASLELGQPSFISRNYCNEFGSPGSILCQPAGVAVDSTGNVWVADLGAGRVLEYHAPIQRAMNPSLVIGHMDMDQTTNCDGGYATRPPGVDNLTTNANELCLPDAVQFDRDGNLWVADMGNGRVLEFVPPFSNGMAAALELGYPASVGMNSPTPWAQGYSCPSDTSAINSSFSCRVGGLAFDAQGNLWVSDYTSVREFVPPFTSGMSALMAIGTPRWNSERVPPTASAMNDVLAIAFDSSGDLIVSDSYDSRILIFTPPFSAGMKASVVIGQPNMTNGNANQCSGQGCLHPVPSASTLWQPWGITAF